MRSSALRRGAVLGLVAAAASLGGCVGPGAAERDARARVVRVGEALPPAESRAALPELRADSPPEDFLRFALFNHPAVAAAYHDWHATVEQIAPARALPDPRLTLEADIADELMTFMPGLMFDFMGAGKRAAMAGEAAAASEVAYRRYLAQLQRTAVGLRRAWIDLAYADEAIELHDAALSAFEGAAAAAGADYSTGGAMGSLEAQVRLRNEGGMHHSQHRTAVAQQLAARARFKFALGLPPRAPDPAWPKAPLTRTPLPTDKELWARAAARNPGLAVMRSMVDMAVAGIAVSERARAPDFAVGAMADLKASPIMIRPQASLGLPVWREKLAGLVAAARAQRDAAAARVSAEELDLAAELAQMLYMAREADAMLAYLDDTALPNLESVADTAAAGYQSGMGAATMLAETRAMILDLRVRRLDALRQRENAIAELLLLTGAAAPDDHPLVARAAPNPEASAE